MQLWLALLPLLLVVDGEEVSPQIEVGTDPQESLTHGDERRGVLDSIGIEVLQLHLVVLQQSPKEFVSGGGEPAVIKVSEGHNITVGW